MITFGSLFSGIGGFDLGFKRAGMRCAWQCEIDAAARAVLTKQFGEPIIEDVRNVRRDNVAAVDLVCGGFPCQDLSIAGKRAGLAGERSGLWFEFRRVVEELKPKWVVVENVPGLLSSNGGADFAVILRGLVKCGYGVAWRVFDAQYFGVAQRRRRVFIVASLGSGRAAEVLFEREGGAGDSAPGGSPRTDVAATVTAGAASRRNGGSFPTPGHFVMAHGQANAEIVKDGSPSLTLNHEAPILAHALTAEGHDASEDGTGRGVPLVTTTFNGYTVGADDNDAQGGHLVVATLNGGGNNGGFRTEPGEHLIAAPGVVRGHMANCSGQSRKYATASGVRRLTPVECERLQGFPDGHTEGQSDSTRYRQLGNAVAVPVIEWIGRRLIAVNP